MPSLLLTLPLLLALVYMLICLLLFYYQRSLLYFPQARSAGEDTPSIVLHTPDGVDLQVTTKPHSGEQAVIYFGGNAEDVSRQLPNLVAVLPDRAVYLLHYRSFGQSSGKPSQKALFADALQLFDDVNKSHQRIIVIGRSLGSGVATYLASQRRVDRMVLITPYDSIEALAQHRFPFIPVRWLLKDKFISTQYAAQVTTPTLIIAAEHDFIVPRRHTDALFTHFKPGVAELIELKGSNHNSIDQHPDYQRVLSAAFEP